MSKFVSVIRAMGTVSCCLLLTSCGIMDQPELTGRWSHSGMNLSIKEGGVAYMRTPERSYKGSYQVNTTQADPVLTFTLQGSETFTLGYKYAFLGDDCLRLDPVEQSPTGRSGQSGKILIMKRYVLNETDGEAPVPTSAVSRANSPRSTNSASSGRRFIDSVTLSTYEQKMKDPEYRRKVRESQTRR